LQQTQAKYWTARYPNFWNQLSWRGPEWDLESFTAQRLQRLLLEILSESGWDDDHRWIYMGNPAKPLHQPLGAACGWKLVETLLQANPELTLKPQACPEVDDGNSLHAGIKPYLRRQPQAAPSGSER
jgi:hypothetical protein